MSTELKFDLWMTGALGICLLGFPLFVQATPPPKALYSMAAWQIEPLNAALANRFYDQAIQALNTGSRSLNQAWLVAAIHFDPLAFSPRYTQYQQERDQVKHP